MNDVDAVQFKILVEAGKAPPLTYLPDIEAFSVAFERFDPATGEPSAPLMGTVVADELVQEKLTLQMRIAAIDALLVKANAAKKAAGF